MPAHVGSPQVPWGLPTCSRRVRAERPQGHAPAILGEREGSDGAHARRGLHRRRPRCDPGPRSRHRQLQRGGQVVRHVERLESWSGAGVLRLLAIASPTASIPRRASPTRTVTGTPDPRFPATWAVLSREPDRTPNIPAGPIAGTRSRPILVAPRLSLTTPTPVLPASPFVFIRPPLKLIFLTGRHMSVNARSERAGERGG